MLKSLSAKLRSGYLSYAWESCIQIAKAEQTFLRKGSLFLQSLGSAKPYSLFSEPQIQAEADQ